MDLSEDNTSPSQTRIIYTEIISDDSFATASENAKPPLQKTLATKNPSEDISYATERNPEHIKTEENGTYLSFYINILISL